jgi:ribose 5-phosphate isomerase
MSDEKKYLRRLDIAGLVIEIEPSLLEVVRQHLDQAGLPYEVLDAPPEPAGEGETQRRRRSS